MLMVPGFGQKQDKIIVYCKITVRKSGLNDEHVNPLFLTVPRPLHYLNSIHQ